MIAVKTDNNDLNKVFSNYFDVVINNWKYDNNLNVYLE